MTDKKKKRAAAASKAPKAKAKSQAELKDGELDAVVGGASFLRGQVVATVAARGTVPGGSPGGQLAAATSQTTLDCWHECTVHISGC